MSSDSLPKRLLTIPEVAEILRVSAVTVRRLLSSRRLTAIKVGGSVRFSENDVESYLKKQRIESIDEI